MMNKMFAFLVLAFLAVPFVALAQSSISLETQNAVDIPQDSIVVLSQEETGVPGYIHEEYAFSCLGELRLVDYYGSAFDPKDPEVLQFERVMCARQKMNDMTDQAINKKLPAQRLAPPGSNERSLR